MMNTYLLFYIICIFLQFLVSENDQRFTLIVDEHFILDRSMSFFKGFKMSINNTYLLVHTVGINFADANIHICSKISRKFSKMCFFI